VKAEELRAKGDRELARILRDDYAIKSFIEAWNKERGEVMQTRRHLLAAAVRLSRGMAPRLHNILDHCKQTLGVELPIELYVSPSPMYNAFSYGQEGGRVFVGLTSQLLEAFEEGELRFVIGHELGHFVFRHHDIPVAGLLQPGSGITAKQALQLFSWQRYAEISSDRAGLACAGELQSCWRAFFKLASGLESNRFLVDMDGYLEQIGDIQSEAASARNAKERPRADWFASHPFSPLRVRAAQLAADSVMCKEDGLSMDELEAQVQELMSLMDPSYLHDKSDTGEAMRRLLFAGGILVAAASNGISEEERKALEHFLGDGSLPRELSPEALRADLDNRIEFARDKVPTLRLAQVIRDMCIIAIADGCADEDELDVIREIAAALDVDPMVIDQTVLAKRCGLD
jgi:Zn-dependent protease with chaperone function/tellurite resistance protein